MLITSPNSVRLGNLRLPDVDTIAIERSPRTLAEEWSDGGPYAIFADVPEQRVTLRIDRRLTNAQVLNAPEFIPGFSATLGCFVAASGTHAHSAELTASVVVTSIKYQLDTSPIRQIITLLAVSASPGTDPIMLTPNTIVPPA